MFPLVLCREKSKTESLALEAVTGKVYELKSPEDLFKKICQDQEVQTKLTEQSQQRCDTFFVVGWRTFVDSKVETVGKERARTGATAKVPVGEAVKANFGVDIAGAADVKGGEESTTEKSGQESYGMEGEFVYAIQYRKVKANKPNLAASKIDRNSFWRVFTDNRSVTAAGPQVAAEGMATSAESAADGGANFEYYEGVFDDSKADLGENAEGQGSEPSNLLTVGRGQLLHS
ncbi:hypothetical protein HG530_006526 [Fusarium avenaceum]|nr:hypothetical protein HG530_006526 [Fusarium avenaceum]